MRSSVLFRKCKGVCGGTVASASVRIVTHMQDKRRSIRSQTTPASDRETSNTSSSCELVSVLAMARLSSVRAV